MIIFLSEDVHDQAKKFLPGTNLEKIMKIKYKGKKRERDGKESILSSIFFVAINQKHRFQFFYAV